MSTLIRSDGFRLSISGVSMLSLVGGLIFIIRLDEKANSALTKFDAISKDVSALRQEMAKDREVLYDHSAQIKLHQQMINDLKRKQVGKEW